ncbi:MAG: hypothetical protein H7331_10910 [Bacteroidia bacterium]|nr:hypothetical protein [Bacteroidia bacterium]
MKTAKTLTTLIIAVLVTTTIHSCKKYNEGGFVSNTEKRLTAHSWKLSKYLRNGNDETYTLYIKNYQENYSGNSGGSYFRSYNDKSWDFESELGSWAFIKDQKKLIISGVSSMEISKQSGTVSSSYYNILKLDKDEFWYYFENGGDVHEFRFVTK